MLSRRVYISGISRFKDYKREAWFVEMMYIMHLHESARVLLCLCDFKADNEYLCTASMWNYTHVFRLSRVTIFFFGITYSIAAFSLLMPKECEES